MDLWQHEMALAAHGYRRVAGVDEAGRGPLAGPVVAAAVILPLHVDLPGLTDSKQLTPTQRERLYTEIVQEAEAFRVCDVSAAVIDQENILQATLWAMRQAVEALPKRPDYVLIDGNRAPELAMPCEPVVKGDQRSASIAAASVLAKVSRDRMMVAYDRIYPAYGFARHKGYPTRQHYEALRRFGPCPIHRRSFRLTPRSESP